MCSAWGQTIMPSFCGLRYMAIGNIELRLMGHGASPRNLDVSDALSLFKAYRDALLAVGDVEFFVRQFSAFCGEVWRDCYMACLSPVWGQSRR
jgi:hypothetical protein